MNRLREFRLTVTLLIVALYMLLEGAFMLVRVPPGSVAAVPTGELLIVFFAATLVADRGNFDAFARTAPIIPLIAWWCVGIPQLIIGMSQHGFWALRDATSLIESSFLWIGFVAAALPGAIPRINRWYRTILVLGALIALTYPFRSTIIELSPKIISAVQVATPLFFTYQLTPLLALCCGAWLITSGRTIAGIPAVWIGSLLIVFVAGLFQARTVYLQIFFIGTLLAFTRPAEFVRALGPMTVAVILFIVVLAIGVPIPGRISQQVSLSFYLDHFLSMMGGGEETTGMENEAVRGAAGGVSQRLNWWTSIWKEAMSSWNTALFGLGYGTSLVSLANDAYIDPAVREPHNSLMSVFGRTGLVGLVSAIWLHLALVTTAIRTFRYYRAHGHAEAARLVFTLCLMFALYWIAAIGEDAFEKPFVAISYYFFFGVILNMAARTCQVPDAGAATQPLVMPVRAAGWAGSGHRP